MQEVKLNVRVITLTVIITVIIMGGGFYYFQKSTILAGCPVSESTNEETSAEMAAPVSQKSLVEYYKTQLDFHTSGEDNSFKRKSPEELGLKEITTVGVLCPENPDGPCGFDLIIVSKETLHSGIQEFYFAYMGGVGYNYFGPFTDDLERLVDESKYIEALKEVY